MMHCHSTWPKITWPVQGKFVWPGVHKESHRDVAFLTTVQNSLAVEWVAGCLVKINSSNMTLGVLTQNANVLFAWAFFFCKAGSTVWWVQFPHKGSQSSVTMKKGTQWSSGESSHPHRPMYPPPFRLCLIGNMVCSKMRTSGWNSKRSFFVYLNNVLTPEIEELWWF